MGMLLNQPWAKGLRGDAAQLICQASATGMLHLVLDFFQV